MSHDRAPIRWGILGAARIAGKALIPAMRAAGHEVAAVAASSFDRAEDFARMHSIPRAFEGYEAVVENPDIDAVYIPLANGLHKGWAIRAARAGKACLCEKPLTMRGDDAREIRAAFDAAGRPVQEAFMWRHHPQIDWLREHVAAGAIGEVRQVHANFSFTLDRPDDYRWKADQGGGALLDIGTYCMNAARLFLGEPLRVSARARFRPGEDGVDESAAAWLDFGDGRLASFTCSFASAFAQGLELIGTEARAWVGRPWLQGGDDTRVLIERNPEGRPEKSMHDFPAENAYLRMVENFARAVRNPAEGIAPGEDGVAQTAAMEALLASAAAGGAPSEVV